MPDVFLSHAHIHTHTYICTYMHSCSRNKHPAPCRAVGRWLFFRQLLAAGARASRAHIYAASLYHIAPRGNRLSIFMQLKEIYVFPETPASIFAMKKWGGRCCTSVICRCRGSKRSLSRVNFQLPHSWGQEQRDEIHIGIFLENVYTCGWKHRCWARDTVVHSAFSWEWVILFFVVSDV